MALPVVHENHYTNQSCPLQCIRQKVLTHYNHILLPSDCTMSLLGTNCLFDSDTHSVPLAVMEVTDYAGEIRL